MTRNERSSKRLAEIAARGIKAPETLTPKEVKALAASVLTQPPDKPKGRAKRKP